MRNGKGVADGENKRRAREKREDEGTNPRGENRAGKDEGRKTRVKSKDKRQRE